MRSKLFLCVSAICFFISCNQDKSTVQETPTITQEIKVEVPEEVPQEVVMVDTVVEKVEPKVEKKKIVKKEVKKEVKKPVVKAELTSTQHRNIYAKLLKKYVSSDGKVNYQGLLAEKDKLVAYTQKSVKYLPSSSASRSKKMAYWINMYNAHMILAVLNKYPILSPMDLAGGKIWDQPMVKIGGELLTLNDVEHEMLRKKFKDPRIHFAVNCAAKSCPPLSNKVWTAGNLESQLEKSTKKFVNDPTHNSISAGEVKLSKIFEWYKGDFGDLLTYIKKYSDTEIGADAVLSFNEYNWNLNKN